MKTKNLLCALFCTMFFSAALFAQFPKTVSDAGLTVTPWPFKQTDNITISLDAAKSYPRVKVADGKEPMKGAASAWIHGGVNLGRVPTATEKEWWNVAEVQRWKNVQGEWRTYPAKCQFTKAATDKFDLKMVPNTHFELGANDKISELCFVINDGPGGSKSAGTAPEAGKELENDGRQDYYVPLNTTTSVMNKDIFTEAKSYPNPSTEYANISFGLKNTSNVTLAIFDIKGNVIKTLINNRPHSGNTLHIMGWDLTMNNGAKVENGAYFYRLDVGGASESGTIMIVR